jgi:hypothetical protein
MLDAVFRTSHSLPNSRTERVQDLNSVNLLPLGIKIPIAKKNQNQP